MGRRGSMKFEKSSRRTVARRPDSGATNTGCISTRTGSYGIGPIDHSSIKGNYSRSPVRRDTNDWRCKHAARDLKPPQILTLARIAGRDGFETITEQPCRLIGVRQRSEVLVRLE